MNPPPNTPPPSPRDQALARLNASRAQLGRALQAARAPAGQPPRPNAIDWLNMPWRAAWQEARAHVVPWVRRQPLTAVGLAALGGVALVSLRHWVGPLLRRQVRPLAAQAGPWLMAAAVEQLRGPAMQAALASLLAGWAQRQARPAPDERPDTPPPAPHP